jgi:hypothetical protein
MSRVELHVASLVLDGFSQADRAAVATAIEAAFAARLARMRPQDLASGGDRHVPSRAGIWDPAAANAGTPPWSALAECVARTALE